LAESFKISCHEHMVMLAYLFVAFSVETDVSERLTEEHFEPVTRGDDTLAWATGIRRDHKKAWERQCPNS
jgi:hypothetical protein